MNLEDFLIPCLFKTLFKIECLGCGLQRAFVLLLKGDFIGAFYMYPAIYMVLLFLAITVFNALFKRKNSSKTLSALTLITSLFMVGGYIYKNIL